MSINFVVGISQFVNGTNNVLRKSAQQEFSNFVVSNLSFSNNDVDKEVIYVANFLRESSVSAHFYGQFILWVDKLHGRGSAPVLVGYLSLAEEEYLQFVFAFEVLAQVYQCGEEGVVVCFEVKGAFVGKNVGHFTFVNQHGALSWSPN